MSINDELTQSKSARKRESTALQKLGERLVELKASQLKNMALPANLLEAIEMAQRINSHSAKRRQLQYIGRLMRHIDSEPILKALNALQQQQQQTVAEFHLTEKWRERLIVEGKSALTEFLAAYPQAEAQHLRHLIREAVNEFAREHHFGNAARALFRYIRDIQQPQSYE